MIWNLITLMNFWEELKCGAFSILKKMMALKERLNIKWNKGIDILEKYWEITLNTGQDGVVRVCNMISLATKWKYGLINKIKLMTKIYLGKYLMLCLK
jgi:hypothetical protein